MTIKFSPSIGKVHSFISYPPAVRRRQSVKFHFELFTLKIERHKSIHGMKLVLPLKRKVVDADAAMLRESQKVTTHVL